MVNQGQVENMQVTFLPECRTGIKRHIFKTDRKRGMFGAQRSRRNNRVGKLYGNIRKHQIKQEDVRKKKKLRTAEGGKWSVVLPLIVTFRIILLLLFTIYVTLQLFYIETHCTFTSCIISVKTSLLLLLLVLLQSSQVTNN